MNFIDIILLIPVLWGGFKGLKNGFISEGGTVLVLIIGIWASVSFSAKGGEYVAEYLSITGQYKEIVAFACIFLLVVIISFFITKLLTKFFETIKLAWLDKLLGIIFGASKYLIVFAFFFYFLDAMIQKYSEKKVASFENSLFFKPLSNSAHSLLEGSIILPIPKFKENQNQKQGEE